MKFFSKKLINWHNKNGRHDLPWQQNPTAYRVWISEIMLQQTQYQTVIPYFKKFIRQFPTVEDLAQADNDEVMHLWSGLGYYARARNLHKTAKIITDTYQGKFPITVEQLSELPGIGLSTAGAIIAFSSQQYAVILDGNVKRVLARYFAIKDEINKSATINELWQLAKKLTPTKNTAAYTQAIMDLGAMVCTRSKPKCDACPLIQDCQAYQQQLTHILPKKSKKKSIPTRQSLFLLYVHRDKILLEKRPAIGIWGNLWCFPECATDALELKDHPGKIQQIDTWRSFRHTFTHFHLNITPVKINLNSITQQVRDDNNQQWFNINELPAKGLAKPVKYLLEKLQKEANVT